MASTKAFRVSGGGTTPTLTVDSDTSDRHVQIWVLGNATQRIAFAEADLTAAGAGFLLPQSSVQFKLQAGDQIWMHSDNGSPSETSFVYFLITKV